MNTNVDLIKHSTANEFSMHSGCTHTFFKKKQLGLLHQMKNVFFLERSGCAEEPASQVLCVSPPAFRHQVNKAIPAAEKRLNELE